MMMIRNEIPASQYNILVAGKKKEERENQVKQQLSN